MPPECASIDHLASAEGNRSTFASGARGAAYQWWPLRRFVGLSPQRFCEAERFKAERADLMRALIAAGHEPYMPARLCKEDGVPMGVGNHLRFWCRRCDMPYWPRFHRFAGIGTNDPCEAAKRSAEQTERGDQAPSSARPFVTREPIPGQEQVLVCWNCKGVNRVPEERIREATCSCGAGLNPNIRMVPFRAFIEEQQKLRFKSDAGPLNQSEIDLLAGQFR